MATVVCWENFETKNIVVNKKKVQKNYAEAWSTGHFIYTKEPKMEFLQGKKRTIAPNRIRRRLLRIYLVRKWVAEFKYYEVDSKGT